MYIFERPISFLENKSKTYNSEIYPSTMIGLKYTIYNISRPKN